MLKKLLFSFLLITSVAAGARHAAAQTDETFSVQKSALAETNLPAGAQKIRDEKVPAEIKQSLSKLVAAGGDRIRQGGSEVLLWSGGNYKKSNAAQLTKKLETALQNSGWTYEIGERQSDFILFSLFRETPARRALVGFFVPSDDAYVFALTEMVAANAPAVETENSTEAEAEEPAAVENGNGNSTAGGSGETGDIVGRWWRGTGSGYVDPTGKTRYKSGDSYTFEFFADGTVEYTYELDVLSIVQCKTKESRKSRGKYSISGDTLTINLNAGSTVGSSTCEAKNNFKKSVPAETIKKSFVIKRMDSITRPDDPWTLCFAGDGGEVCFEKEWKK